MVEKDKKEKLRQLIVGRFISIEGKGIQPYKGLCSDIADLPSGGVDIIFVAGDRFGIFIEEVTDDQCRGTGWPQNSALRTIAVV